MVPSGTGVGALEPALRALAELLDGPGDVSLVTGDLASLSAVRALAD